MDTVITVKNVSELRRTSKQENYQKKKFHQHAVYLIYYGAFEKIAKKSKIKSQDQSENVPNFFIFFLLYISDTIKHDGRIIQF